MNGFIKRLFGGLGIAIMLALTVARFMLEVIGYAGVPDDVVVARSLIERFLIFLIEVPPTVILFFFAASLCVYIWYSWRAYRPMDNAVARVNEKLDQQERIEALSKRLQAQLDLPVLRTRKLLLTDVIAQIDDQMSNIPQAFEQWRPGLTEGNDFGGYAAKFRRLLATQIAEFVNNKEYLKQHQIDHIDSPLPSEIAATKPPHIEIVDCDKIQREYKAAWLKLSKKREYCQENLKEIDRDLSALMIDIYGEAYFIPSRKQASYAEIDALHNTEQ